MVVVTAGVAVLALLLVYAGVVKLRRPEAVRTALRAAGLPSVRSAPQLVGITEVAVGAAALVTGHVLAPALLAATYAVFAVFSVRQRRRGAGCGCFGEPTEEVSRAHIGLDLVGAVVGTVAAVGGAPAAVEVVGTTPVAAALVVLLAGTAVAAVQLLVSALPELTARFAPEVEA